MKNSRYEYQKVYSMIRNAYVDSFPYPCVEGPIYVIEKYLLSEKIEAHINDFDEGFRCVIKKDYSAKPMTDNPFENQQRKFKEELEAFFINENNVNELIADIVKMTEWLVENNFITSKNVANEKMLEKERI